MAWKSLVVRQHMPLVVAVLDPVPSAHKDRLVSDGTARSTDPGKL